MTDFDRYITGGRYRSEPVYGECPNCEAQVHATAETEYGATVILPEECPTCHEPWPDDMDWKDDEPPEPDPDRYYDPDEGP